MSTLNNKQVEELFGLMKHSDSVELKLTVADSAVRSTVDALGMDPLEAEIRQVVFFDTPDLALSKAGVVVRARRMQGGGGDTVIKLRPVNPANLPPEVRQSASVKVEVDAMPKGFVCSASMKGKTKADDVRAVILGKMKIRDLLVVQGAHLVVTVRPGEGYDAVVFRTGVFRRLMVDEATTMPRTSRSRESGASARPAATQVV